MLPPVELKFAVVREDPALETELIRRTAPEAVLIVASGGCTALALAATFPRLAITAFDLNPLQLAHLRTKAEALARGDLAALNVGDPSPAGLNQRGAFEGLFRTLRAAIDALVAEPGEIERYFASPSESRAIAERWARSKYWPAAFETAFNQPLLHAMFGPEATQNAEAGSYPRYFQAAFERGLLDEHGPKNPFLAHVLFGAYRGEAVPDYIRDHGRGSSPAKIELVEGGLETIPRLERFGLFSLSNIFDWSDDALVGRWARSLIDSARPGAVVLIRQLNNRRNLRGFFEPSFRFDDALGRALLRRDRSLFYERIEVGFRGVFGGSG